MKDIVRAQQIIKVKLGEHLNHASTRMWMQVMSR